MGNAVRDIAGVPVEKQSSQPSTLEAVPGAVQPSTVSRRQPTLLRAGTGLRKPSPPEKRIGKYRKLSTRPMDADYLEKAFRASRLTSIPKPGLSGIESIQSSSCQGVCTSSSMNADPVRYSTRSVSANAEAT